MNQTFVESLVCPYCAGTLRLVKQCGGTADRLDYGLVSCRCFTYPIVHGVLLLSLAKGYGGAEEEMQPYVPLQVAAIEYLQRDDVNGLLGWIDRHLPLAADLIHGRAGDYLRFAARMEATMLASAQAYLAEMAQFEVLGGRQRFAALRRIYRALRGQRVSDDAALRSYFVSRFFAPRVNALAMQLASLPMDGRVLSLCCGHGVFENLALADGRVRELVSVDGQFLNLLVTKYFVAPDAHYVCHDVQFPLPFADGAFDGVVSSTCLPEIPAQQTVAREAIRVARRDGWTLFDSIWNTEMNVRRIDRGRHYRFCQNFFEKMDDYLPFFEHCAGPDRQVLLDIPDMPAKYLNGPQWLVGEQRQAAMAVRKDPEISVLVTGGPAFRGFTPVQRPWLRAGRLSVSPVFTPSAGGARSFALRPSFAQPYGNLVPASFPGYAKSLSLDARQAQDLQWLTERYCEGQLALLPTKFSADVQAYAV